MRDLIQKEQGFTLIELMLSVGLVGTLGALTYNIQSRINDTTNSMEASLELNSFMTQVSQVLSGPNLCTYNFGGRGLHLEEDGSTEISSIQNQAKIIAESYTGDPSEIARGSLGPHKPFSRHYVLSAMTLSRSGNSPRTTLRMQFAKVNNKLPGLNFLSRKVNLYASYDDSNILQTCHTDLSAAQKMAVEQACSDITGSADLNADGECNIHTYESRNCGPNEYMTGFTLNPDTRVYEVQCASLNIGTGSALGDDFAKSYNVAGTGSLSKDTLKSGEVIKAFGTGVNCPTPWSSTTTPGVRHNNIFNKIFISETLDINCLSD